MSKQVKQEKTVVPLTASFAPAAGGDVSYFNKDRPIRVQVRDQGQFFRLTVSEAALLAIGLARALDKAEKDKAWDRGAA